MTKTKVLKCDRCGSILVLPSNQWYLSKIVCTICGSTLKDLGDDFDLSEIITCDSCKTETGVVEEP